MSKVFLLVLVDKPKFPRLNSTLLPVIARPLDSTARGSSNFSASSGSSAGSGSIDFQNLAISLSSATLTLSE